MQLSIIIPAFEENRKVAADIRAATDFLKSEGIDGEVIVVDDGSSDNTYTTAKAAGETLPNGVTFQVIRNERHRGKGYAISTGVKISKGHFVMFADSGVCVPYSNALKGLELLKAGKCEIAHGSRQLVSSSIKKKQPVHRRLLASFFRWTVRRLFVIPRTLTDTQCGFKIYMGECGREIFSKLKCDGFMFDIETIVLAQKLGYRIQEFPVEWQCDLDSRIKVTKTSWPVLRELWDIKRRS